MHTIAICIPTFKRIPMLERLIKSIIECSIEKSIISNIDIFVVDNDKDRSAERLIEKFKHHFKNTYNIHYNCFPAKGISNVRNQLITDAFTINPTFIIFIDDDEFVTKEWLIQLVQSIISNKADAVLGPVIAVLDKDTPAYISYWFKRDAYHENTLLQEIKTGNLILNCKSLKEFNVFFDSRFNSTGSEDSYFGRQLIKKGAKIQWASKAIVYEEIPRSRANLKWLIKRKYRVSCTYTYVLKLEKKYFFLFKKLFVSVLYVLFGIAGCLLLFLPIKKRFWGVLKLTEGIGGIIGLQHVYKEYK